MLDVKDLQRGNISRLIIYGEVDYVTRLRHYLQALYPSIDLHEVSFPLERDEPDKTEFILTSRDDLLAPLQKDIPVLICFTRKWQEQAATHVQSKGFTRCLCFDADMDNTLKKAYLRKEFPRKFGSFKILAEMPDEHAPMSRSMMVYQVRNRGDKQQRKTLAAGQYVKTIQTGCALTSEFVAQLRDDVGDNISAHNPRYCELTAFYWLWKHAPEDFVGLCHYRRVFANVPDIARKLQTVDVDALLPMPTLFPETFMEGYFYRYMPEVWPILLEVIKDMAPEYVAAADEVYNGRWQYGNNLCILSRQVLNAYAGWLFPLLAEMEERVGDLPNPYRNRYIGFSAESLMTLYFLTNQENWRIAHVEKLFLG